MQDVITLLVRALHLLGLTLAPTVFVPEPRPGPNDLPQALVAVALFAVILASSAWMGHVLESRIAKIARVWCWIAVLALFAGAAYQQGAEAPLARAVGMMALPVWGALATSLAALAVRFLGDTWSNKPLVAILLVTGIGAVQLSRSAAFLRDPEQMWWATVRMDGGHRGAVQALSSPLIKARKWPEVTKVADRCLKLQPDGCACLELRAEVALRVREIDRATSVARHAIERCVDPTWAHALAAEALTFAGQTVEAESEARDALAKTTVPATRARLAYVIATALAQQGKPADALVMVRQAIDGGAGRDARILGATMASIAGDFAAARGYVEPVVKDDPRDVDAQYSLALVLERSGDRAAAREVYLTVLRLDPLHPSARYNLAMIAMDTGNPREAREQARQFIKDFPQDPRKVRFDALLATPE